MNVCVTKGDFMVSRRAPRLLSGFVLLLMCSPPGLAAKSLAGGRSATYRRAMEGDLDAVREYVRNEKNLAHTDHSGRQLLHWLVRYGHLEGVRIYLDAGGDVDFRIARENAASTRFKKLLDESRMDGATPLYVSAETCKGYIARLLAERGADVNAVTADGSTPLIAAARSGCSPVAELLIEHGADVDHADRDGMTPLLAVGQGPVGRHAIQSLLEEWDLEWFHTMFSPLGGPEVIDLLLKHGADPQRRSAEGESILYLAAERGDLSVVERMLEAGASPEQTTKEGRSPALAAASFDRIRVAERLVEAGARGVIVKKLIRDVHGTAVLHELVAKQLEENGDRKGAFESYSIAADYFRLASIEFEAAAKKQQKKIAKKEFVEGLLRSIQTVAQAYEAQTRSEQLSKLAALRDAVDSGGGLTAYHAALDKHYREAKSIPWNQEAVDVGNLSLDQRLTPERWVWVFGARALLEREAAVQIQRHLDEHYPGFEAAPGVDPVTGFFLRTRRAWLDGKLNAFSTDYEREASAPEDMFLKRICEQAKPLVERAEQMKPIGDDEFLASFRADKYLLTNRTFYVFAGTPRLIPVDRIAKYKVKLAGMDLMIQLDSGEKIVLPELKRFPKPELMQALNPEINQRKTGVGP